MGITRVNFNTLANGGDTPTGALVRLDANCVDLDTRTTAATSAASGANTNANTRLLNGANASTPGLTVGSGACPSIAQIEATGNSNNTAIGVTNGGNNSASAVMSFLRIGIFRWYLGQDTDGLMKVGSGSSAYILWHQGNTTVDSNNFIKKA